MIQRLVKYPCCQTSRFLEKFRLTSIVSWTISRALRRCAVKEIFGTDTEKVLSGLEVEFFSSRFGYMGVSDEDGHLFVSADYLKNGDSLGIYLDVIHELVHVKQFREGKELFDETYEYADRPTELEAYRIAVKEARRLGMGNDEIFEYLKVTWLEEKEVRRLAENVGVTLPKTQVKGRNARVH